MSPKGRPRGPAHSAALLHRVVVVGTSCSGKTSLARRLAKIRGIECIELDALHWAPGWREVDNEVFRREVGGAVEQECWVVDGNYSMVRDLVWPRAETILWLNYSFPLVFGRALRRTLGRIVRREVIFSGNRESLRMAFFSRDSILLWVIQTHGKNRRTYRALSQGAEFGHLRWVEFRHPEEVEDFLRTLGHQ